MSEQSEKERREIAIFNLITERTIQTQQELVEALLSDGFDVTQATVSRDVRRLGLVKKPLPSGGFAYSVPARTGARPQPLRVDTFVTGVSLVEAFCAINTLPGRAMAVAVTIDEMQRPEIAGTLAGDDLVLVMIKKSEYKEKVEEVLRGLL